MIDPLPPPRNAGAILYCIFCFCSALGLHLLSCCILTCGSFPSSFNVVTQAAGDLFSMHNKRLVTVVRYELSASYMCCILALHPLAPNGTILIDSAVAVKCFLLATSYLIVVGDNIPDALESIIGTENRPSWLTSRTAIFGGLVMTIPLVWQKNFAILRYSSTMVSYELPYSWRAADHITITATLCLTLLFNPGSLDSSICGIHGRDGTSACIWCIGSLSREGYLSW